MEMSTKQKPALSAVGWELLRLGAFAFGGLGATLTLLQRGLIDKRRWLRQADISEALAFTKALPGSTGIQVVAYLGWRIRGWPGALVAATAFIAPATLLMIVVAAGSLTLPDTPWVQGALTGIQVGVVGLLAAAICRWRWLCLRHAGAGPHLGCLCRFPRRGYCGRIGCYYCSFRHSRAALSGFCGRGGAIEPLCEVSGVRALCRCRCYRVTGSNRDSDRAPSVRTPPWVARGSRIGVCG